MYNADVSPTVTDCTFTGCKATYGGGMANGDGNPPSSSSPTVINCKFIGNTTLGVNRGDGGGIYNENKSNPTVINSLFSGNSSRNGGGMWSKIASPQAINCLFVGNTATSFGGGVSVDHALEAVLDDFDCCIANGTPGCEDGVCQDAVCAADPCCCNNLALCPEGGVWDGDCADLAADLCIDLCRVDC